MYFAPREANSNIGAQHPIHHQFPFRDACKSLLMTGRPCLAGGGHRDGSRARQPAPPSPTNQACVPPSYKLACVSNCQVLVRLACISLQPPLYICIRLRAPRLLRPSCESPVSRLRVERHGAVEAGLCFGCLELCPCFHLVEPSGRRRVAVAVASLSLSTRSRAPRLLRPSSESPGCTEYQIGSYREALTSSLDRALTSSSRWPWGLNKFRTKYLRRVNLNKFL